MTNINEYGELAPWDTTSRAYRKKIRKLNRRGRRFPSYNSIQAYQVGLETWEQSRAELGIYERGDYKDPRWGRFFVPKQLFKGI
jgi:hypothetical protein